MPEEQNFLVFRCITLILYMAILFFYIFSLVSKKSFRMNSKPLTEQPLFTAALLIPFISFIAFGLISWIGHSPQLDGEGLNNFIEISKLPLALLSLSVPFGVIVNNIHRTIQTNTQINEAQVKNKNDLYYSHQKNTIEHLEKIEEQKLPFQENPDDGDEDGKDYVVVIEKPLRLYRKIYSKISITNFSLTIDEEFKYTLNKSMARIKSHLEDTALHCQFQNEGFELEIAKNFHNIEMELRGLAIHLEITPPYRTFSLSRKYQDYNLVTDYKEEAEMICVLFFYVEVIESLCDIINLKPKIKPRFVYDFFHERKYFSSIFDSKDFYQNDRTLRKGVHKNDLSI